MPFFFDQFCGFANINTKGNARAVLYPLVIGPCFAGFKSKLGLVKEVFDGMMASYKKFFGTDEQPNKPARSAVQVAALVAPGALVEIEVIAVKPR